jgi:predicted solute-binding protein
MLRIGSVPYLVARPLIAGLSDRPDVELSFAPPNELASKLKNGKLDIALASSVLSLQNPELRLWETGPMVACEGPVKSVAMYLRPGLTDPQQAHTIALDQHSCSGRELVRIILREKWPAERKFIEIGHSTDPLVAAQSAGCDAIQLIGDPALRARLEHPDWECIDLGEEWHQLTGLPFVFAGWIGRQGFDPSYAAPTLESSAELGLSCLNELADFALRNFETTAAAHNFDFHHYLSKCIRYQLPAGQVRAAIAAFAKHRLPAAV